MKTPFLARYSLLAIALWVIGGVIILQMFHVQTSASAKTLINDTSQYDGVNVTVYPARGSIYDRNGTLLAGNEETYQVGLNLDETYDSQMIASAMSSVTGAKTTDILYNITYAEQHSLKYIQLRDYVTQDQVNQLKKLQESAKSSSYTDKAGKVHNMQGLTFTSHLMRSYPENSLASNILGYYPYMAGNNSVGNFGIEQKYNDLLAGTPEVVYESNDPLELQTAPDVAPGASLVLTIDRNIQAAMEKVVDQAVKDTNSTSGTIIVEDPTTGEILAMANSNRMNLNEYWNYSSEFKNATDFNRAVMTTYEPGSVFKVITMASALNAGAVKPETTFVDTGSIEIGGITIINWDGGAYGTQTMTGCLQHSLNVCLTWVAEQLGATRFYNYLQAFGIGHTTGIDLADEAYYPLAIPGNSQWFESDLGTNSFGQGVAVTPIQMVMAISAVANEKGEMMAPHLVKAIIENGHQYNVTPQVTGNPITAATAQTETEMLATSLENEASTAMVAGYRVAGKTGTAEIPTATGYSSDLTNASFVGWGPVSDPKFLVYIWLEKPESSIWGSVVAAPIFSQAFQALVTLTNLPPDSTRSQSTSTGK